jgi:hypothetical protein
MAGGPNAADAVGDVGSLALEKQIVGLVGNTCWKSR